jgi:hypothetical protein
MSPRDGSSDIFVLRLDGSPPERITTSAAEDWDPDWWTAPEARPVVTVGFVTPEDGASVTSPFRVAMEVGGLEIAPAGELMPGTGHHHIVIAADLPPAGLPIPTDAQHLHFGQGQTETLLELPRGTHRLTLLFADGEHVPYDRQLNQTITVTVE